MIHVFSDQKTFAFLREYEGGQKSERLLMVMNNADGPRAITLNLSDASLANVRAAHLLAGQGEAEFVAGSSLKVPVAARSMNIYRLEN